MASNSGLYSHAAKSFTLTTKCLEKPQFSSNVEINSIPSETWTYLAAGKSGIVYGIDQQRVLKQFHDVDGKDVEHRAYERLGSHPNIAKLLGIQRDGSIILERGTVLRSICQYPSAGEISIQKKLSWLKHAAQGYQHLHDCDIIHGDVGCNNMIVTKEDYVKIIDLEGCSIDGESANSCYEWFMSKYDTTLA